MRRSTSVVAFAVLTLALGPKPAATQARPGLVSRLVWIAGCWEEAPRGGGHTTVEEQWMTPRAGAMIGMSRMVRGDTAMIEFERLRVFEHNGRAVFHAEPSDQPPADFETTRVSDTLVVFENAAHDFPQRVIYHKRGADSLLARIEGTTHGATRAVDYPYARVRCANQR